MTHEEKINYMRIANGIVGYGFETKTLDMIVSIYDLILLKQGETDLHNIVKIECEVEERELKRIKENPIDPASNVRDKK